MVFVFPRLPDGSGHAHFKFRLRGLHDLFQVPRVYDDLAFIPACKQGQDVFLPNLRLIHRSVLTEAVGEPVRRFPIQGPGPVSYTHLGPGFP